MSLNFVIKRYEYRKAEKQENVMLNNNNQYGLYSQLKGEKERGIYLSSREFAKLLILERRFPEFKKMYLEDREVFSLLTKKLNEVKNEKQSKVHPFHVWF